LTLGGNVWMGIQYGLSQIGRENPGFSHRCILKSDNEST
jgi:hypothetical protein